MEPITWWCCLKWLTLMVTARWIMKSFMMWPTTLNAATQCSPVQQVLLHLGDNIPPDVIDKMIKVADADGNGVVCPKEFMNFVMGNWFPATICASKHCPKSQFAICTIYTKSKFAICSGPSKPNRVAGLKHGQFVEQNSKRNLANPNK